MMRIGYVVKRFPRYSETFIVTELLAHEVAGWDVEIFSLRPPNDTHFQDVLARVRAPVRYLPSEGTRAADFWTALQEVTRLLPDAERRLPYARGELAGDVYQALILAAEVRRRGITHLHAHFANVAATVAGLAARLAGVPFTFTAHAKDIFHESVRPDDLRRKLQSAAAVLTVSDFNLDYLRQTYGTAAAGVRRIYNGLDLDRFPYRDPALRPNRAVAVGRLVEKKGFEVLIEATALLVRRGVDLTVDLIGAGELEEPLRHRVTELSLESRVRLLGPRPQAEIVSAMAHAVAFAAPCVVGRDGNRDGLPTTLLEAMALGTPCVSTDVTGIPEVVRDGETGLIVRQNDPAALAAALERLLTDPALRVDLARRARRRIEEDFDARVTTGRLRQVIESLHGADAGAPSSAAREAS